MNLNKRAMEYARRNNYYKPSKIKKYLYLFDKKISELREGFKPSICPDCGNECTEMEYDDREYYHDVWMFCGVCGEIYDDYEYIDKYTELDDYNYFDDIELSVWGNGFIAGVGYEWFSYCDEEMDKMIKELSGN